MDTNEFYEEKLKAFMKENGIDGEHLTFSKSCHSVAEAAEAAGVTPGDFVKSICMVDGEGRLIVGIVKGEDRASTSRVAKILEINTVRIATPEEVFEKTGYPCGGTPSFSYPARFFVDPKVMEKKFVYMGGGSETSLVRINPSEIVKVTGGKVARIRK
ncbi:MAG TPA: YbaK/EbsC family protein [Thermodesulfobacteriota bacterium]|nr:YbaK/EbsC family protein [Thermodesulfobacteriota bacterium]